MSHPATNYLKYLVIKGLAEGRIADARVRREAREAAVRAQHKGPTEQDFNFSTYHREVQDVLIEYNIPSVSEGELSLIAERVHAPRYLQFGNPHHTATADYMKKAGVYSAWRPAPGERELFYSLLKLNMVKDLIKILLMGRVSPLEISSRVSKKFKVDIPVPAVELFHYYFWNVPIVSHNEWREHLRGDFLKDHMMSALDGSPGQALYRAGFNPKIDGDITLKDLQRTIHYRLEATRMMGDNSETASIISRLSKELVAVHQILYGEGAGLEDTLKKFREFKMELKNSNVQDIRVLAPHGNFSNSGTEKAHGTARRTPTSQDE